MDRIFLFIVIMTFGGLGTMLITISAMLLFELLRWKP